ncbi:MAG: 1,5-anhydro-D-fructose reductase [Mycobacteriales bacterium]
MVAWAMIGAGRVNAAMAKGITAAPGANLAGVLSRDAERARRFADSHAIPRVYESLDALVGDPDVDVVYVASPNGLHREHVLAAAAAGKHVLCEKPMANDVAACQDMVDACRLAGVELGVAFQYRQHEAHRAIRSLVADGRLGPVVCADAAAHVPPLETPAWYADQGMAGGGVVPMSGVHRIDLLRFLLGDEVEQVAALVHTRVAGRPYEDTVAALLHFANGAVATLRFVLDTPSGGDGISVHGTDGWAETARTTSGWWGGDGGELSVSTGGPTSTRSIDHADLYQAQVDEFSSAVSGGPAFCASGLDGLRAAAVTAALFEAGHSGRVVRVEGTDNAAES